MPTAPKLVAAICLAFLGYVASELIKTVMPQSTDFGMFSIVSAAIGFVCGWVVIGTRAGRGYSAAISNGFTGTVALVFWGLFVQSVNEMVKLAMARVYHGPVEAFAAIFEIGIDYGAYMVDLRIIVTLLVGGILVGWLTEAASYRWR